MAEKQETAAKPSKPTITLPPKPSMDTMLGLHSPGPMTLVSSFFSDYCPESADRSFSQLLAGAMNSPLALMTSVPNQFNVDATWEKSLFEVKSGDGGETNPGYKQSRPTDLAVVQSPMFTAPPGLSPSGLLYSPSFFSCQSPFGMSHQQALAQVTAQAALSQPQTQMETESSIPHPSLAPNEPIPPPSSSPVSSIPEPSDTGNPVPVDKPSEDGYNWRKYGQKQVKGCEYPRSYYKCTYLNCLVKKIVERAHDGRITEIIYKGQHNHELPQNNKRGKDCGSLGGGTSSLAKVEVVQELAVTAHTSGSIDNKDADDVETITIGEDADDDEPNTKRRNVEAGPPPEVVSSHKTVAEPKIIVQTRSEVDLLDDGYRWRKYGQKVVKGSPHPRSYYKCTFAGCNVRKHVERAAADPKAVITTYEGKHKHTVPGARNSSHTTAANTNLHKPNPQKAVAENIRFLDQRPAVLQLKEERVASLS